MSRSLVAVSFVLCACASGHVQPVRDPEAEAAPSARVRACEALAALDAKALAQLTAELVAKDISVEDPHAGLGVCVAATTSDQPARRSGGAWILVTQGGEVVSDPDFENNGPSLSLAIDLYFVADDGRSLRFPNAFSGSGEELGTSTATIEGTFDWDDDGLAEVAIVEHQDRPDFHTRRLTFFRVANDKIGPWVPIAGLSDARIEDIDDDKRPDILDDYAFVADIMGPMFEVRPGFSKLYHALPKGHFASDDTACKTYYRAQCPERFGLTDLPGDDPDEALRRAMCAAMYGADRGALETRLDEIYAVAFAFILDMDGVSEIPAASIDIPVRFP